MWRWVLGGVVVAGVGLAGYGWWMLKGPPRQFFAELLVDKYAEFGEVNVTAVRRARGNWWSFHGTAVLSEPRYDSLLSNGLRDLADYCGVPRDHVFEGLDGIRVAQVLHPVGTEVELNYRTAPYRLGEDGREGDFIWRGWSTGTWGGEANLVEDGSRLAGFGREWFERGGDALYVVTDPEAEPLCQGSGG